MILVTGGAGFIGANFVIDWIAHAGTPVVTLDKLTYAGNLRNLDSLRHDSRHFFVHGDICDSALVSNVLRQHRPRAIVHFAAESHVDRSIHGPEDFVQTNIVGTFRLLDQARAYWRELQGEARERFRFLHVSTDEVYGSLAPEDAPFTEASPHAPNSPYAASKAAADHLARAYHHTYGLPVITTNCSNNYGPYQFPEKFLPIVIANAMKRAPLPVYGDGANVRDWLFVKDHCEAIRVVLERGRKGETYNIGGSNEKTNLEVVKLVCALLDQRFPENRPHESLIEFVADRPGHDRRYAIDTSKIERELGWRPRESFETGLQKTLDWYVANQNWLADVTSGAYREWIATNYGERRAV